MKHSDLAQRFEAMIAALEGWARTYRVPAAELLAHAWLHLVGATDPDRCTASTLAYYSARRCWRAKGRRDALEARAQHVQFSDLAVSAHSRGKHPDHAETIAWRELWAKWLASLGARDREIVQRLGDGEKAYHVARAFAISPGRVSQIRKRLRLEWQTYCS